jgi:hypothetical protein
VAIWEVENNIASVFFGLRARFDCDDQAFKFARLADIDDKQSGRFFT